MNNYCFNCKKQTSNTCCSKCLRHICTKCMIKKNENNIQSVVYYYCPRCINIRPQCKIQNHFH